MQFREFLVDHGSAICSFITIYIIYTNKSEIYNEKMLYNEDRPPVLDLPNETHQLPFGYNYGAIAFIVPLKNQTV